MSRKDRAGDGKHKAVHFKFTHPKMGIIGSGELSPYMDGEVESYILTECIFHIPAHTKFFSRKGADPSEEFNLLMEEFYRHVTQYLKDFSRKNGLLTLAVGLDREDYDDLERLSPVRLITLKHMPLVEGGEFVLGIIDYSDYGTRVSDLRGVCYGTS